MTRLLRLAPAVLLTVTLLSCAGGNLVPERHSMPAARAALAPEYRLFYDALVDYGDWILIEPWGYVFRPRNSFDTWRPFAQGMWVPTDQYGWVWVSSEPYGWATYHYGDWVYDPFQGYVWRPGLDWSPAQVVWQATDSYVGWAPRMANPSFYDAVPGGAFSYVPVKDLGATDLSSRMIRQRQMGSEELQRARVVHNEGGSGGASFNKGPRIEWVERHTGMLQRARVDDLVPRAPLPRRDEPAAAPVTPPPPDTAGIAAKRAGIKAATEAKASVNRGDPPARVPLVRPYGVDEPQAAPRRAPAKPADAPKPKALPTKDRKAAPDTTAKP
jgi:hypothetical protein